MAEQSAVQTASRTSIQGEEAEHLSLENQNLGMWLFLISEIMFFGAVFAAYVEKSLKDVAFNPTQDDFQSLDRLPGLDKAKPVIFACNGAECWKSYKAAKVAAGKGYKSVYWLRGGLPEWVEAGLPTEGG